MIWKRHEQAIFLASESFLDSSILFSDSLAVAGTVCILISRNFYGYRSTRAATIFALNPLIAATVIVWPRMRRRKLRSVSAAIATILSLSFWIVSIGTRRAPSEYTDSLCYNLIGKSLPQDLQKSAILMKGGYVGFAILATALSSLRYHRLTTSSYQSLMECLITNLTVSYALFLSCLDYYRILVLRRQEQDRDGPNYLENNWGYGDFLVL